MYPGALPSAGTANPADTLAAAGHTALHNSHSNEARAIATKVGTGASTPASGLLLRGNGAGTSAWAQVGLTTDVSGVLPTANGGTGGLTNLLSIIYPVGCIFAETTGVNPGTTFGFGTWVAFGKGRVLIGAGTSDQVFTAGASGGESNHALITAELASHTHTQDAHAHTINVSGVGGVTIPLAGGGAVGATNDTSSVVATNQNTGSGTAHNNLPPYLVCYYWTRTA